MSILIYSMVNALKGAMLISVKMVDLQNIGSLIYLTPSNTDPMNRTNAIVSTILACISFACQRNMQTTFQRPIERDVNAQKLNGSTHEERSSATQTNMAAFGGMSPGASSNLRSNSLASPSTTLKIARTATLTLKVERIDSALRTIGAIVERAGGYTVSERQQMYNGDSRSLNLQVRLPAERLDTVLEELSTYALETSQRSVQAEDITEQYVDSEARLASAKRIEEQYFAILKQAHTVVDVLAVQEKLGAVRQDIESREAQVKYLSHRTTFSTIEIMCYEGNDNSRSFPSRLRVALSDGWSGFIEFLLGLVRTWYLVVILLVSGFFLRRWWHRQSFPWRKAIVVKPDNDNSTQHSTP